MNNIGTIATGSAGVLVMGFFGLSCCALETLVSIEPKLMQVMQEEVVDENNISLTLLIMVVQRILATKGKPIVLPLLMFSVFSHRLT